MTRQRILKILPWALPATILCLWLMADATGRIEGHRIPRPGRVWETALHYFGPARHGKSFSGRFLSDFTSSGTRVLLGFGLAILVGLPLGVLSGRRLIAERFFSHFVNGIRAVPSIALFPLALLWFGVGTPTTVFLIAVAAFFPIYLNTLSGIRGVSPLLLRAGAMLGVDRLRGTFLILLPAAMPQIRTGLRLGLGITWAYLVLGELTGVPDGLGAVIMDARTTGRVDMIVVGIVTIAVIGRVSDRLLLVVMGLIAKSARRLP